MIQTLTPQILFRPILLHTPILQPLRHASPFYAVLERSATKSNTGGTAYGQNIKSVTTGTYIKTVLPTRPAGLLKFHGVAARVVVYCLNCLADPRWICVRASAERIADRGAMLRSVEMRSHVINLMLLFSLTRSSSMSIKQIGRAHV